MLKSQKGFSKKEKEGLRGNLQEECAILWTSKGYKKTSISYLTSKVGISTGAFYLLYKNKEELFLETMKNIREELKMEMDDILSLEANKTGFVKSLKWLYLKYSENSFLYDFNNPDFQSFVSKIPKEYMEELNAESVNYSRDIIKKANLKYRVDENIVFDVIQALLYTVSAKEDIVKNKVKTFNFLIDEVVDRLFI